MWKLPSIPAVASRSYHIQGYSKALNVKDLAYLWRLEEGLRERIAADSRKNRITDHAQWDEPKDQDGADVRQEDEQRSESDLNHVRQLIGILFEKASIEDLKAIL